MAIDERNFIHRHSQHLLYLFKKGDFLPGSNYDHSPAPNVYAKNARSLSPLPTMPAFCGATGIHVRYQTASRQPLNAEAHVQVLSVHVRFMVDKVTLGQVYTKYDSFPVTSIPPMLCTHSSITDAV